jgi:bifunctional DNA-binding transcriptional regulator/antitoxin component of YhaV-PrlF toxin-antitoxin module
MKPRVYKGGRPGKTTYYLLIPKDIVEALGISPNDEFILNVEQKDGELVLAYKRIKK